MDVMKGANALKRNFSGLISIFLASLLLSTVTLAAGCSSAADNEQSDTGTPAQSATLITDMAGRQVSVNTPAERIVLASARHLHEFAAVGGAEVIDRIVGWGSDLNLYDQDTYLTYQKAFPQIDDITDIGYHYKGTFSVETVVTLDPDVVVFPLWLVEEEGVGDDIFKLEKAGIPSVFIDYYTDPFEHPVESTTIIGRLLGKEARAKEVTDFYQVQVNKVSDRLKSLDTAKTTAYVEVGSKGPSEYGSTYSGQGLGALITRAGGDNIAAGIIEGSGAINPEYLLTADPDIIVISGSYWPATADSMRLGYHATEADSRALLKAFTERGGWDTLSAVQNGRVYSVFHGFSFRIYNFAGIQAFARWLYPDLFSDMDPAANFREFHEKFMPVEYSGVWMLDING
jgi:iron complex transport system substrate-binding protein